MVESLDRIKGSDDKGVGSRVSKIEKTFYATMIICLVAIKIIKENYKK